MANVVAIVNIVLPVFLVIAVGYAAARTRYLPESLADGLNAVSIRLAIPILLFNAMLHLDLDAAFHVPTLFGFYAGALGSFIVAALLARWGWKRSPGQAVAVGFCATFSNTVLMGIPISQRAFGPEILDLLFGLIALHAPVIYGAGMITMEFARRDGKPLPAVLTGTLRAILSNTLMVGIIAGIGANLTGLRPPGPIQESLDLIARAAIPISLIGIGIGLTRFQLKSELAETAMVCALALVAHPTIVLLITHTWLGLPAANVKLAVLIAAMPPGVNVYIFALMYNRAVSLAASVMIIGTVISVVTVTGWLWLLERLFAA